MSTPAATLRTNAANVRKLLPNWAWTLVFLGLAIVYPLILDSLIGPSSGLLDASIQTLAYIIMALGLNIVVGFAGLLDLGYVAFFAIGAFVMGWLGSQQFPNVNGGKGIHILTPAKSAFGSALPGIHINFFIVIFMAAAFTAIWGVILGAPTLRLRGDYLAIVTLAFGEIVPRVFENSTSGIFGIGHTDFSNGRQGITPIDKINLPWSTSSTFNSLELKPFYWVALAMLRAGDLLQHPPARLAAGPRVDRGARGRGRRRGDGRQPGAHEAVGLRDRRVARRLRRACSSGPTTTP